MTSQGIGLSYRRGEEIRGYEACELKGSVYIGPGDDGEERLRNLSMGDEMIYRYVEIDESCAKFQVEAVGTGRLEIMLGDYSPGTVTIQKTGVTCQEFSFPEPGIYELKLTVLEAANLEIRKMRIQ